MLVGVVRAGRSGAMSLGRRSLYASTRCDLDIPKPHRLTLKEYRMGLRKRRREEPACYRELIDYLNALANNEFENEHPKVVPLLRILDKCHEEAEKAKKQRVKSSLPFHLSKYLKR